MRPLRHGYTNHTVGDGAVVEKTYAGPDAPLRLAREQSILMRLRGRVPVPPIHSADDHTLRLGFVAGVQGQDLIEAGHADAVLRACGSALRRIHTLDLDADAGGAKAMVLVHGDYGPNNVLLDPTTFQVTAVLDWEFAHLGDAVEDLAWCEWIIRTHHPRHVESLTRFYAGYGSPAPPWPARKAAMVARCRALEGFTRRWAPDGDGVRQWRQRVIATDGWQE